MTVAYTAADQRRECAETHDTTRRMKMSEISGNTPLEVLLGDPIMKHFNLEFIEKCRAELAQLRASLADCQADRAEFGVMDGVTYELLTDSLGTIAVKNERIAELGRMLDNSMADAAELTAERDVAQEEVTRLSGEVGELTAERAEARARNEVQAKTIRRYQDQNESLLNECAQLRAQLVVYQRREAIRQ